jgi:hypothetical protein
MTKMIALRVKINNQPAVTGGAEDLSVLTAIVTATGKLGEKTHPAKLGDIDLAEIDFRLGGLTSRAVGVTNEHVCWLENIALTVGDKLSIEVVETDITDPIASSRSSEANEEYELQLFEFAKKNYLALREKYE